MKARALLTPILAVASASAALSQSDPRFAKVFRLSLGEPAHRKLVGRAELHYYAVNVPADEHLFLFLHKDRRAVSDIFVRYGALPEPGASDASSSVDGWDQALDIVPTRGGTYYILVKCARYMGPCQDCPYTLLAHTSQTWPALAPGQRAAGIFRRRRQCAWYRLAVPEGEHLYVFLERSPQLGCALAINKGRIPPWPWEKAEAMGSLAVDIPQTEENFYYVVATCGEAEGPGVYELRAETDLTWPSLPPGETVRDELAHGRDFRYWRVEPGAGHKLSVVVEKEEAWPMRVLLRHGTLPHDRPHPALWDACSVSEADRQTVEWPRTEAGPYYILVKEEIVRNDCGPYTITLRTETQGDPPTSVQFSNPQEGELTSPCESHFYQVSVRENEHLFVFLDKSSPWKGRLAVRHGALPTTLVNDASSRLEEGDHAVEVPQTLAGMYYIQVQGGGREGGCGKYALRAETLSTWRPVQPGVTLIDEVTHPNGAKFYRMELEQGQHLFAFFERSPEWFSAAIQLRYGSLPAGRLPAGGSDAETGTWYNQNLFAEIPYTEAGVYYVAVKSDYQGNSFGSYELTLHTLDTWPGLELGRSVEAALQGPEDKHFYHVAVDEGKRLSVVLEKSEEWCCEVSLRHGDLLGPTDVSDFDSALRQVIEFPHTDPGEYFISVTPCWETAHGETPPERRYHLTVSTLDPAPPPPRLVGGAGADHRGRRGSGNALVPGRGGRGPAAFHLFGRRGKGRGKDFCPSWSLSHAVRLRCL